MSKYLETESTQNPFLGKRVVVRTYSAGVHVGELVSANGKECELKDSLRIWSWEGSFTLSNVANKGISGGRITRCPSIYLTEAIEYIPITAKADATFLKFVE